MSKLFIETRDAGARVNVSVAVPSDPDAETRLHIPRRSSRPPALLTDDEPTRRRMIIPRPARVPRFSR